MIRQFRFELGLEAGVFVVGIHVLHGVQPDLVAGFRVFLQDVPIMGVFFHLMFFGGEPLRFEATLGVALFGS